MKSFEAGFRGLHHGPALGAELPRDGPPAGRVVGKLVLHQAGAEPGIAGTKQALDHAEVPDFEPPPPRVDAKPVVDHEEAVDPGDLAPALARRGRRLLIVLGRGHASPDQVRSMLACLDALAAQGVEVITLSTGGMPAGRRRVAEPAVGPALLDAGRAGLSFRDAAFGPAGTVAAAAGVERGRAAALQLELVDGAAAFRAAVWPRAGAEAGFDRRLAARGAELRRQAASEPARGTPTPPAAATTGPVSPAGAAADPARPRSMLALGPDGNLELRQLREGELVALVPTFDPDTGTAGLAMMSPGAADALGPVRSPAQPRPAPRRPSALGALWRAVRRLR